MGDRARVPVWRVFEDAKYPFVVCDKTKTSWSKLLDDCTRAQL
jgi:hypothetical protein